MLEARWTSASLATASIVLSGILHVHMWFCILWSLIVHFWKINSILEKHIAHRAKRCFYATARILSACFNFKRLYSTQIYKGKAKTCVLHSNVWRLLSRYMHTACIRATKKIIDWMTFLMHTIAYDQRNQTSYTDAQNLSQWRTVWIMGHGWLDVKRKYKGSGKSNSVQYKICKPICRLYEIAGAC